MMFELSKVLYRNLSNPLSKVNASDFACSKSFLVDQSQLNTLEPLIPYSIDFENNVCTYVAKVRQDGLLDAAFQYAFLRENAEYILNVPFLPGGIWNLDKYKMPTFIFSTGRCGSTLLSKIILKHSLFSISEPDFYTQLACAPKTSLSDSTRISLFNQLTIDLLQAYRNTSMVNSKSCFVKLRAECNQLPQLFLRKNSQKTIFLSRDFISWAKSIIKNFNKPNLSPESIVNFYIKSIKTLDFLSKNSQCTHITYNELIHMDNNTKQVLQNALDLTLSDQILTSVLQADSQEESILSKSNSKNKTIDEDKLAKSIALYQKIKPSNILEIYNL